MKSIVISDTHGLEPKRIYDDALYTFEKYNNKGELQKVDNIIFIGDYMDSKYINPDLQIKRLMDLFDLQACDERIHLLVGNHDVKYLDYKKGEYKDKLSTKDQIEETVKVYNDNLNYLEYAFFDGKYIYSHCGITNQFLKTINIKDGFSSPIEVVNTLNKMLQVKMYKELFYSIDGLKYRHCIKAENPDYSQYNNLLNDAYKAKDQVVGHYDTMGLQVNKGIFIVENSYHGNYILFES